MKPAAVVLLNEWLRAEDGGLRIDALALTASVFGAAMMAMGRFDTAAQAQTQPTQVAAVMPHAGVALQMQPAARAEVEAALRAMSAQDLSLAYARIHATFRLQLGADDLSVARALVDYATLAEADLRRRNIRLPAGTESPAEMLRLYELVL